ncbi:helix-turn-helix transcriptional regulator [Oceanobacillus profundus]|uniref:helix-turn-helix domain-containing protein n=1 Tax=Oceanobacillus TaxID=182709 RepID=UPI0026E23264|nr:helix-turn-helix transcriptional regulator [Oceanobacillus profundus]MDO6448990.1 helix-turn-helix transcriptional regulator [Oceanobacillus profundus]
MFSKRLKKLRENKKMSQQEVADYLSITRQGYAKYEKATAQPDFDSLKKLSLLFKVSIDYLITGNEYSDSPDEMWKEFLNPKTQVFFKDLQDAPEEKVEELIRFWEFIQDRDKKK